MPAQAFDSQLEDESSRSDEENELVRHIKNMEGIGTEGSSQKILQIAITSS